MTVCFKAIAELRGVERANAQRSDAELCSSTPCIVCKMLGYKKLVGDVHMWQVVVLRRGVTAGPKSTAHNLE